MAHNTRTQDDATWTTGNYIMPVSDWQSLDAKVFAAVNGDRGGTWAPSSPIVINGSGMSVTGPTLVAYGGSLKSTSGARFVLGNGEWPKLSTSHVGRTRTLRSDLLARQSSPRYHWSAAANFLGGIQSVACTVNGASGLEQPKCSIPLRVHDGARLTSATLTFRVSAPHRAAPVATPRVRLVRTDRDGNLVPMRSVASGADADGWVSMPAVSSGAAWYADGAAQTFEYACDQNNAIDRSSYLYWAQIIEEAGTIVVPASGTDDGSLVRERKAIVKKAYTTNQGLTGLPSGASAGDAVLLTGESPTKAFNGIWIVGAGTWPTRRGDLIAPAQFTPGFLVVDQTAWEMWECVSPIAPQSFTMNNDPTVLSGGADIVFQRVVPRGNVYHALACHFDSISDMRPQ